MSEIKSTETYRYEREDSAIKGVEFFFRNHTPSWQRYNELGRGHIELTNHESAQHLSMIASESSDKSTKEIYLTLDRAQAIAMRDHLNKYFEGES